MACAWYAGPGAAMRTSAPASTRMAVTRGAVRRARIMGGAHLAAANPDGRWSSARPSPRVEVDRHAAEHLCVAESLSRPADHAAQRVLGDVNVHVRPLMQEHVHPRQQAPT